MPSFIHAGKTIGVLQGVIDRPEVLSVLIVISPSVCPYPFHAPGNLGPVLVTLTNTSCFHVLSCRHFSCITVYVFI